MFGRGVYESKEICRKIQETWALRRLFRVPRTSDVVARAPLARNWGDSGRNISSCFLAGISSCPIATALLVCSGVRPAPATFGRVWVTQPKGCDCLTSRGSKSKVGLGSDATLAATGPDHGIWMLVACCNLWDNRTCDIRCHLRVLWIRWPYENPTSKKTSFVRNKTSYLEIGHWLQSRKDAETQDLKVFFRCWAHWVLGCAVGPTWRRAPNTP